MWRAPYTYNIRVVDDPVMTDRWPRRGITTSPRALGKEHLAVGGHCGLAAGGVVGEDGHHVAADRTERVAVVDPAGAVHLAQPVECPADLMLRVDHVAAGAHRLGFGDLAAGADGGGAGLAPGMQ